MLNTPCSLRTQTYVYFRKITSASPSHKMSSVTSQLLFSRWPIRLHDRMKLEWPSHNHSSRVQALWQWIGGNTELPQHEPQSYRAERSNNNSTAETNEGLNPQFNALHSSQRSYNVKERIKRQIAVIGDTISCHKNKSPGPAIQKLQVSVYYTVKILSLHIEKERLFCLQTH